jgi:hypothetical protein
MSAGRGSQASREQPGAPRDEPRHSDSRLKTGFRERLGVPKLSTSTPGNPRVTRITSWRGSPTIMGGMPFAGRGQEGALPPKSRFGAVSVSRVLQGDPSAYPPGGLRPGRGHPTLSGWRGHQRLPRASER